jgi:hypothetical protein
MWNKFKFTRIQLSWLWIKILKDKLFYKFLQNTQKFGKDFLFFHSKSKKPIIWVRFQKTLTPIDCLELQIKLWILSTKYKLTPHRAVPFKFPNYTIIFIFHCRLQLRLAFLSRLHLQTRINCYSGINSTQSPASSASNVIESELISKVGRVREFVCA